jgi:hypothetical protein
LQESWIGIPPLAVGRHPIALNMDKGEFSMASRKEDDEAGLDDLGTDPGQVGPDSAGQSGDPQALSPIEDASEESVEELADTNQAVEAEAVSGSEDAADHPERPVHTHDQYRRPEDVAPQRDENIEPDDLKRPA